MPRPTTKLKKLNPKCGDLVINVRKSNDRGMPMISVAYFESFLSGATHFKSTNQQLVTIHQRQPALPFSAPDIRVTETLALEAITEGSFYLARPEDTKTLYRVLEANGFALEADVLVQYNPSRVEPS